MTDSAFVVVVELPSPKYQVKFVAPKLLFWNTTSLFWHSPSKLISAKAFERSNLKTALLHWPSPFCLGKTVLGEFGNIGKFSDSVASQSPLEQDTSHPVQTLW